MVVIWYSGSWTKCYFVGTIPIERSRRRRLALYYGYPYILMGIKLCHLVEIIEASEDVIETPAEAEALWQRTNIYDARAMLGLYCYRAGYFPAAMAQWNRIPERNRVLRPEIARLLTEVDTRLALEKQETQPMRRDQLIPKEPILTGNLPPADLPNPYEPIRSEEKEGGMLVETWNDRDGRSDLNGEDEDEGHKPTMPLRNEIIPPIALNGHSNGKHKIAKHRKRRYQPVLYMCIARTGLPACFIWEINNVRSDLVNAIVGKVRAYSTLFCDLYYPPFVNRFIACLHFTRYSLPRTYSTTMYTFTSIPDTQHRQVEYNSFSYIS